MGMPRYVADYYYDLLSERAHVIRLTYLAGLWVGRKNDKNESSSLSKQVLHLTKQCFNPHRLKCQIKYVVKRHFRQNLSIKIDNDFEIVNAQLYVGLSNHESTSKDNPNPPQLWRQVQIRRFALPALKRRNEARYSRDLHHYRLALEMERIEAQLYIGIESAKNGSYTPIYKNVLVCRFAIQRLEKRNGMNYIRDVEGAKLIADIQKERGRIYAQRNFPARLRTLIFARDGYTCIKCLRGKKELLLAGLQLEVDHRIAWEDGGQTCYDNGDTLCSECNKIKHTTKKFFFGVEKLYLENR